VLDIGPYIVFLFIVETAAGSGNRGRGVTLLLFIYNHRNILAFIPSNGVF